MRNALNHHSPTPTMSGTILTAPPNSDMPLPIRSQPVSVIVITKNEASRLARTLQAVQWAQEIIVVDSGSTDGTQEIARLWSTQLVETDWPGFGPQKNRALSYATCPWILSIDADEWVSPELSQEIAAFLQNPSSFVACTLPRLSSYCGRAMRHSGWWPDPVCRFFRRGQAVFSDDRVHEKLLCAGPIHAFRALLEHESFQNLNQVLQKVNHYSEEGARQMLQSGKQASLGSAIGHGLWAFFRTYVVQCGFLDGREGFILAVSNAQGTYYRYLKLMYLLESQAIER